MVATDRPAKSGTSMDQDDGEVQRHHRHQNDRLQLHEVNRGGHRGRQAGADRECRRRLGRAAGPDIAKAGVPTRWENQQGLDPWVVYEVYGVEVYFKRLLFLTEFREKKK